MAKREENKDGLNDPTKKTSRVSSVNTKKATTTQRRAAAAVAPASLLLSKENYIIIGVGLFLVIVGFFLMSGGQNTPDEWLADEIYSFRRITLAPFVVLFGLGVVIFAIFKSSGNDTIEHLQVGKEQ